MNIRVFVTLDNLAVRVEPMCDSLYVTFDSPSVTVEACIYVSQLNYDIVQCTLYSRYMSISLTVVFICEYHRYVDNNYCQ